VNATVRPGDQATLTILAFEAELTALGLLPAGPGGSVRPIDRPWNVSLQPTCGTPAGRNRHRRAGQEPCPACLAAYSADQQRRYRARTAKGAT